MDQREPGETPVETRRTRLHAYDQAQRAVTLSPTAPIPTPSLPFPTPSEPQASAVGRARLQNSAVNSHLHIHRLRRRQRDDDSPGTVQETMNRLRQVTSTLASAINDPLPVFPPNSYTTNCAEEAEGYSRRSKRRKLDGDPLDTVPIAPYGYHGQVVPGRLKMEIFNCDGGHLTGSDEIVVEKHYWPINILRNDKSVYCTKRDKCNLMLAHVGEAPFTVTKIVIKTPDSGFTAPVREGLIFVSMSARDLVAQTSQYHILDGVPHPVPPSSARSHYHDASAQSTRSPHPIPRPYVDARPPSRRRGPLVRQMSGSRYVTSPSPAIHDISVLFDDPERARDPARAATADSSESELNDSGPYSVPETRSFSKQSSSSFSSVSDFNVTISCDEPSGDEEDPTSPAVLLDRQRRRNIGNGNESETSEDDQDDEDDESEDRPHSSTTRSRRLSSTPRKIEWISRNNSGYNGYQGSAEAEGGVVPHAKFFIERKKHVVSVKFDPPVSGKFVLLKLWSPQGRSNIDIQCVSVYGFAGPRFHPAVELA